MDKIFICKDDTSNKFWGYKINGMTVTCKWGRLGTAGQSKDFSFKTQYDLNEFVNDKTEEKTNKGYDEMSPEQLELETTVAQTIGVGNKIEKISFAQLVGTGPKKKISLLDPKRDRKLLHDPSMQPMVYAVISGRRKDKESYEIPIREFLLSMNDAKVIKTNYGGHIYENDKITIESELPVEINDEAQVMAKAVGACIGKLLL